MIGVNNLLALYRLEPTRKPYNRGLRRFLEYIYDFPIEARKSVDYSGLSLQYLQADRDTLADLRGFVAALDDYAVNYPLLSSGA